jgi:putative transposase
VAFRLLPDLLSVVSGFSQTCPGGVRLLPDLIPVALSAGPAHASDPSWLRSCHASGVRTNYPRRLPGFDYLGCYQYFLTFCVEHRVTVFSEEDAVSLVWSQFLRAAADESFSIIACCFMPDHVHMVVEGLEDDADLKRFISRARQFSGYHYRRKTGRRLWQRYGYEHVLRDDEPTKAVVAYVLENPVRAGLAKTVYEYPHITSTLYRREELVEYAYGSD